MTQTEIGRFIAQCRKEKKLTQSQLAEKLNITDRAVSKWETGKCMPDSSIMLELCKILGITVNELLSGEKIDTENFEKKADENLIALERKAETGMAGKGMASILFSAALLLGIVVCLICDIAISGKLTWSLIPVSSIAFAWAIFFPAIILGKWGAGLLSLSVLVIPYLFLLSSIIKVREVFSVGAVMATVSIVFAWIIAAIFICIGRVRRWAAFGISFLTAIPFMMIVNVMLSKMTEEPAFDVWDALCGFILIILALASFAGDHARKKGKNTGKMG